MRQVVVTAYVLISFGAGALLASRAGEAGYQWYEQGIAFVTGAAIWPAILGARIMYDNAK